MTSSTNDLLAESVQRDSDRIVFISHAIHSDPEFAYEEHNAVALITSELEFRGFVIREGAYGFPTAFEASAGTGPFRVVICAEYDAVPGLGHAGAHNLTAAAAVGAAVALAERADELGLTVTVLGTPAEEHGGGKMRLIERGALSGVTMAVLLHGVAAVDDVSCSDIGTFAAESFDVTFSGTAVHIADAPHRAVNAGDAATIALVAVGLLRQHLGTGERINAFVDHGGEATNVIPDLTIVRAEVSAPDRGRLDAAKSRMLACFEAGALATGCSWGVDSDEAVYEVLEQNTLLAAIWDAELRSLGRNPVSGAPQVRRASGMGNISQLVPTISPTIAIRGATGALHSLQFAEEAVSSAADAALLDGALAMARTIAAAATGHTRTVLLNSRTERHNSIDSVAKEPTPPDAQTDLSPQAPAIAGAIA